MEKDGKGILSEDLWGEVEMVGESIVFSSTGGNNLEPGGRVTGAYGQTGQVLRQSRNSSSSCTGIEGGEPENRGWFCLSGSGERRKNCGRCGSPRIGRRRKW